MRQYSYPSADEWDSTTLSLTVPVPKFSRWVRKQDNPLEFEANVIGALDRPTRVSAKFDSVSDIYGNASYIDSSARVANHRGVRNSFAYSEVGVLTDTDDATFEKLIPASVTINVTESVLTDFSDEERMALIWRAFMAFFGISKTEAESASFNQDLVMMDYLLRLNGDLRPHNFAGSISLS